jgi:phage N-6-adenine-methyltransferase
MINKALFSSSRDNWETPQLKWEEWDSEFHFDIDVCASISNTKCKHFFTINDNALEQDWYRPHEGITTVWINCPYGRSITGLFVKKCYEENKKGAVIVALLPARTDTKWFHSYIYNKATEIRFIKGRLVFEIDGEPILDKNGRPQSAPFPSMIVIWR